MEFTKIMNLAISHKARLENTVKDYDDNRAKIYKNKKDLETITCLYKTTDTAHTYLEALIKGESTKFIKKVRGILDHGVKTIFFDEDYSIDIRTDEDTVCIHLVTKDSDGNIICPDIKNCGGGIRSVVGILSQLYFIFHYKAEPIIFIDEGLSQVSSLYIPYMMALLEEMAKSSGLKILLITHDNRMMSYADKTYEIEDGVAVLRRNKRTNLSVKERDNDDTKTNTLHNTVGVN